jgi:ligand-binding sensor domain-containing protein
MAFCCEKSPCASKIRWLSTKLGTVWTDTNYVKEKGIGSLDGKKDGDLVAIISMEKDNDDLWMATYNQGVWRNSGKQITHYPVKNNGKDITVFSIYKGNNGELWLGTHENGAYKFNGTAFEKFTQ